MDIRTIMEEEQLLPYRRCYRPMMVDGKLDWNAGAAYIHKPEYAKDGALFVRSFYHIQEELQYLFKYIEPASGNRIAVPGWYQAYNNVKHDKGAL